MEQQLEELLDTAISNCRPMTRQEKHQLLKYIQKLQPKNLDRVVEIIGHKEPSETISSDEIFVDLEKQMDGPSKAAKKHESFLSCQELLGNVVMECQ
ncbi:hypothetical protein Ancab_026968 [Ancistrocladus abbreviatus]